VLDGKLYAIGGMGLESVEIFDPQTNEWSFGPNLPAQVKFGTAIGIINENKILLFGGLGSDNRALDQVLVLWSGGSPPRWRLKTTMPTARNSVKLIKREEEIWVIGGYDNSYSDRVEIFHMAPPGSWEQAPSLGTPRDWPVAWLANDRIYVGGGQKDSSSYLQSIEAFDFKDNRWTSAGSLPEPLGAADSVVVDGKVYLVAGSGPGSDYSKKVYAADISSPKDLYIRISSQESE
jgi:N-acetylneuraminic acid mutarotase